MKKTVDEQLSEIMAQVEAKSETPFVTGTFGNSWKDYAIEQLDFGAVVNIAWKQGRKAILLKEEIRKLLKEKA